MKKIGIFSLYGGIEATEKTGCIGVRYIGWWTCPGHRQNTIICELYEKDGLLPSRGVQSRPLAELPGGRRK